MSSVTYESLRELIRSLPDASEAADEPGTNETLVPRAARFGHIFGMGGSGAHTADPGTTIFDLELTRLASGWGGIVGCVIGALLGSVGGVPGVIAGILLGALMGSLVAVFALIGFAAGVARIGATWTLALSAAALLLVTWTLAQ